MRRLLALIVIVLAGCVSPRVEQAQTEACDAQVESIYPSGRGNTRNRAQGFINCERADYGNLPAGARPLFEEYWAYWMYLATEIEAGRISIEQGTYQKAQKKNELINNIKTLDANWRQQQPAYRPVVPSYRPPPTYNTNCSTDPWGNTNCTTRRQ